ncbi:MAG: deoxyguanosinetriphosphate triphosphohydrolase [Chloroflexi bacterium]|nr:deoxyguanosinetriphosphate triphosphohydrolase [Chloroflexota bacterium]
MNLDGIRQKIEDGERRLSPLAAKSRYSRGRQTPEDPSPMRSEFQRDRDRIIHSKAFRRLKHKTQVFIAPLGDHYVTRLTHTLEVAQIARTVARALNLNEDLTEAISLAHDLGHTPFGHTGEEALDEVHLRGFRHNEQSLRVVDFIEKDGRGLNLTWEVRDGILRHSKTRASITAEAWGVASTLEGQIVKMADSVAYINHDIGDAIRAGVITPDDLPKERLRVLGVKHSERVNTMVSDIIGASWESAAADLDSANQDEAGYRECQNHIRELAGQNRPLIQMSPPILEAVDALREYLFQAVYQADEETAKAKTIVKSLYNYFCEHYELLPAELTERFARDSAAVVACDYVSGMTDRYALKTFENVLFPRYWRDIG